MEAVVESRFSLNKFQVLLLVYLFAKNSRFQVEVNEDVTYRGSDEKIENRRRMKLIILLAIVGCYYACEVMLCQCYSWK